MRTILLILFFWCNMLCFGQDNWGEKSVTDNHAYKILSTTEFNTFIKNARQNGEGVIYNPRGLAELLHSEKYKRIGSEDNEETGSELKTTEVKESGTLEGMFTYIVIQIGLGDDSIDGAKTYCTFKKLADESYILVEYKIAWKCSRSGSDEWTNVPCP